MKRASIYACVKRITRGTVKLGINNWGKRMSNIIQVVEVTPTPRGQWVTFWHASERLRISGEIQTSHYVTMFDRGDLYVCLSIDSHIMSIAGPHPVGLLTARELTALPVVPDQNEYGRHDRYSRFDLDRETALLTPVSLSEQFVDHMTDKSTIEQMKIIASLH